MPDILQLDEYIFDLLKHFLNIYKDSGSKNKINVITTSTTILVKKT